jgi:catalase
MFTSLAIVGVHPDKRPPGPLGYGLASDQSGLVSGAVATTTLWEEIVDALNAVNGSHAGHRAVHAKGTVCTGTFTPTPEAAKLSRAGHLQGDPVEATIRFSNASGDPHTSDTNPIAGRGMAVKFHLPDGEATDIVSVPLVVFMVSNPEDFLELTRSRIPDPETGQPDPDKLGAFLAEHPETGIALQKGFPKLAPTTSYVTSEYRALHSFCLVDADGGKHWGRYSWESEDGVEYLTDEQREAADRNYLQEEIRERLAEGNANFTLEFTLANGDDPLDDPTVEWVGEREVVELGELEVLEVVDDPETPDNPLVFDPMRLTDGIEPSGDKILAARPKAYSVSIERRTSS